MLDDEKERWDDEGCGDGEGDEFNERKGFLQDNGNECDDIPSRQKKDDRERRERID